MKELAFRLVRGDDLRMSIEEKCREQNIGTAVVLSGVGCVYHARIRLADASRHLETDRDHEIVSLTGTVSKGEAHIHVALADDSGSCIGGHLEKGCLINTTAEIVLGIVEEYDSAREYDEDTGYDEIVFREVD